jgi:hypothetical protein
MTAVSNIVSIGDGRMRLSDEELHRQACKAIWEGNHVVFESLPSLIARIIEHKIWRSYQHKDFASYALDATGNGLGVNTNQRLWILKCSMDFKGKHIKEWSDVLQRVEEMVMLIPVSERGSVTGFNGNSLEDLAKNCENSHNDKIMYLPSRSGPGHDRYVFSLRKKPDVFRRLVRGELSMVEARREARNAGVEGMKVDAHTTLGRAKQYFEKLDAKERREFIAWMKEEGYLE